MHINVVEMVNKFKHWLSHLMKTNTGDVITWRDRNYVFVGFRCHVCGEVDKSSVVIVDTAEEDSVGKEIQ